MAEVFADQTRWFDIWRIDVDTSEVDVLVSTPDLDENPRFSPDGRFVAFHRVKPGEQRDSQKEVWVKDIETGELRRMDRGFAPAWSPDGQWIVYGKWVNGNPDIYKIGLEGGDPERLTTHPARDIYPYWGQLKGVETIVFSSSRADPNARIYDVWAMNPDGSNKRRLSTAGIETGHRMFGPAISPDGELVAFWEYDKKQGHSVWTVDAAAHVFWFKGNRAFASLADRYSALKVGGDGPVAPAGLHALLSDECSASENVRTITIWIWRESPGAIGIGEHVAQHRVNDEGRGSHKQLETNALLTVPGVLK